MTQVDDFLEHYGVKGMRWGHRKSDGGGSGSAPKERGKIRRGLTKAGVALDAGGKVIREGEQKLIFLPQEKRNKAAQITRDRVLGEAAVVNRDPRFKGKDLKGNEPLRKAYYNEVAKRAKQVYAEELDIARTEAWGDFLNVDVSQTTQQMRIDAAVNRIRHADEDREILLALDLEFDELGHIVGVKVADGIIQHDESEFEDALVHYGVKGMKWGFRKRDTSPVGVTVSQPKPGRKVKAEGGQNQPASEDAKRAAAARQLAKKSTTDALSNQELQQLVNRMNLEQQYARLAQPQKTAGQKFAEAFLGDLAKRKTASKLDDMVKDDPNVAPIAEAFKKTAGLGGGKKKK